MNKNYFEIIRETILSSDRMMKFTADKKEKDKFFLTSGDLCYEVNYNKENNQIFLNSVDTESDERKVLSSWLLDDESFTQKDADMISKDFIDTMAGKGKSPVKQGKKKSSSDESNVTGLFFANRMVNIFPELKEEIQAEKECYAEFRSAIFAKEHIAIKVNELVRDRKEKARISKFGKLLSDLYQNGNLDARSIITMVILNSIEDEAGVNNLKPNLSDELQKAWEAALKYKGKTVKPEKPKKKNSFMSKVLSAQ